MKKLEILDVACNELSEISGLESQVDSLEELWLNNNNITSWDSLDYIGKTLNKIDNLYIACNPVYTRGNEFKEKLKISVPKLK